MAQCKESFAGMRCTREAGHEGAHRDEGKPITGRDWHRMLMGTDEITQEPWARSVDRKESCCKCGGVDVALRWHPCGFKYATGRACEVGEHLHYWCRRCGYEWVGPTRDCHHNMTASAAHEGDFIGGE